MAEPGMGSTAGYDLARRLLGAFVQSPSPAMVAAYGERLALFSRDVGVPVVNFLIESCESRPSVAMLMGALSSRSNNKPTGEIQGYPAGMDPEAEHYTMNGRTYARMPKHKRDTYVGARTTDSDPYRDLPREEQIRLLRRGIEFFRKRMPDAGLAAAIVAGAERRLAELGADS